MPELLRQAIDLFEARPMTCVAVAIAVILYLNLMMSDPRVR
jgi:hypothetical protein